MARAELKIEINYLILFLLILTLFVIEAKLRAGSWERQA